MHDETTAVEALRQLGADALRAAVDMELTAAVLAHTERELGTDLATLLDGAGAGSPAERLAALHAEVDRRRQQRAGRRAADQQRARLKARRKMASASRRRNR